MDTTKTLYIAAAFTDQAGGGSPTGVVLDADGLTNDQMQAIANKVNCSHTAFFTKPDQPEYDVGIRFFTAGGEIKNCGHGTIAAHVVRVSASHDRRTLIRQKTASGIQAVEIQSQDSETTIFLKQDAIRFYDVEVEIIPQLLDILKVPASALDSRYPIMLASPGAKRFLVALNSLEALEAAKPDFVALKHLCERLNSIGCFLFTFSAPFEASARMFAPNIDVDEDIINGNSSGCLGAYRLHLDKTCPEIALRVYQGQAFGRPGTVLVKACRTDDSIETIIGGKTVIESVEQIRV